MSRSNTALILASLMMIQSVILVLPNVSANTDSDGDGYPDSIDDCYNVAGNSTIDRTGCPDSDGDGWSDYNDRFPSENTQWNDTDNDGYGDNPSGNQPDSCTDYYGNSRFDRYGCYDSDYDGYSNPDAEWTVEDGADAFPFDWSEWADVDYDGRGDNNDYCRSTGINESSDGYGCSLEDKLRVEEEHTSILERRYFNQEISGTILLSNSNYSGFHKWFSSPIPMAESGRFQIELNTTTVGASATGFYIGYRVHTNAGTCQGSASQYETIILYSFMSSSTTNCVIPHSGGDAFIHIFGSSSPYPAATIEYNLRITPEEVEDIIEVPFVDPLGDGDLDADSYYGNYATSTGEISGYYNFSAGDHDDKITVDIDRTRIDRIAFTSDGPQIIATSGLSNCDYDILNSGNPVLDCLIVDTPVVSLEDRIMKSRMRFGIDSNGDVCQSYTSDEFANQSTISDFKITNIFVDSWGNTRMDYSSNYSGMLDYNSHSDYRDRYYRVEAYLLDSKIISTDFHSNDGNYSMSNSLYLSEQLASELQRGACSEVEVQLSQTMGQKNYGNMSWSLSHEIRNEYPVESAEGDQEYSMVYIPVGTEFSGALGYSIDNTDEFQLEIPHGYEMDIAISANTPYKFYYPESESCASSSGSGSDGLLEMQSGDNIITCEISDNVDDIEVRLQHIDSYNIDLWKLSTDYTITIERGSMLDDDCCYDDDAGSGDDATSGTIIVLDEEGEFNGSFEYFTDYTDPYLLRVPANKAALIFINGLDLVQTLSVKEGDMQYSLLNNPSDEELDFQINVRRGLGISNSNSHFYNIPYLMTVEFVDATPNGVIESAPQYIGAESTEQITYTQVEFDSRLTELRLDTSALISSSQQSIRIPLEFSPLDVISMSITQSSGEPLYVRIMQEYSSSNYLYLSEDLTIFKSLDAGAIAFTNRDYTTIDIGNIDSDYITIKSSKKVLSTTNEGDWNLTPSATHTGKLGYGIEGLDSSDEWNFTISNEKYATFEITTQGGLGTSLVSYDNGVRTLTLSNGVIVCPPEQIGETADLYNGILRVNRLGGTGDYLIMYQEHYGTCPLSFNTDVDIINGWGSQQSVSINPGDAILLEVSHSIRPSTELTIGIQDESKKFIESIMENDKGEISQGREHLLTDDLSKLMILKIPESTPLGNYKIVSSLTDVVVTENTITIGNQTLIGMGPTLPTGADGIMAISPFEDATWFVSGHEQWTGKPLDWTVEFNESWIRAMNGSVIMLGDGSEETHEGRGNGMVSTAIAEEARIGSLVHHQVVLTQGNETENWELLSYKSRIEVNIEGDNVTYSDSSKSINEVRFKLSAMLENTDRPIKGFSGTLNLKDEFGEIIGSKTFDTDGKGEDLVILLFASLKQGVYTTEIIPDEKWNASIRPIEERVISIEKTSSQSNTGIALDEFQISYDLRRNVLIGTETVQIDWASHGQLPVNMQWSIIEIDSGGNQIVVVVGDEDIRTNQTSGLLEVLIPESIHQSNNHYVRISAISEYGLIWNSGNIGITGIERVITPTITYSPLPPAPGDEMKIKFNCDCKGNYLSWDWKIYEANQEIGSGEGWSDSDKGELTFTVPYSTVYDLRVYIYASDGDGNTVDGSLTIPMQKLVNLAIEAPLYGALDVEADLSWEITSRSLTEIDKATEVEVVLQSLHSTEPLARKSLPEDGYRGDISMHIPSGLKPGIYKIVVTAKLASGETLTQESFIEITDPILGIEALAVTPENNRYMLLFVAINVVAIWVLMFRARRKKEDQLELLEDDYLPEKDLVDVLDSFQGIGEDVVAEVDDFMAAAPSATMNGVNDPNTNCEWLEYPQYSGVNWYRYSQDQEWTKYEG